MLTKADELMVAASAINGYTDQKLKPTDNLEGYCERMEHYRTNLQMAIDAYIAGRKTFNMRPVEIFRHFKGRKYLYLGSAYEEATTCKVAIYQTLDEPCGVVYTRPWDEFFGYVEVDGKRIKRFEEVV